MGNVVKCFESGWVNDWVIGWVSERLSDSFGKSLIEIFGERLAVG